MMFNNKKELVAWVKAVIEERYYEMTNITLAAPDLPLYILIPRSLLKDGKCDYLVWITGVPNIKENTKEEDIKISGIPVYEKEFTIKEGESLQEQVERYTQQYKFYGFEDLDSILSDIKSLQPAYLCDLHEWFVLSKESYKNYEFKLEDVEKNTLPLNFEMENLGEDCFKGSTGVIGFPTHLLLGFVRAGIDRGMELIPIGSGARGFGEKTARTYDVVQYDNFLLPNHSLRVHWDKLTVSVNDGEEQMFMENFYWEKFYNEVDELAICMVLYHYNIALNAPYTQGLYDIFMEKFNEKRD